MQGTSVTSSEAGQVARASDRTLGAVLLDAAAEVPGQVALVCGDRVVTYEDLADSALKMCAGLQSLGLSRGDRVLVMLDNSLDFVALYLGCALAGIVEVPVNADYRGRMLEHIIEHSEASAIVIEARFAERLTQVDLTRSRLRQIVQRGNTTPAEIADASPTALDAVSRAAADPTVRTLEESEPVAVMYTSGTTGPAKGVVISHRHAYEYARTVRELVALTSDDVYYAPLPLFHLAGKWAVIYAALQARCCVYMRSRFSVSSFWDDVRQGGVTASFVLGAMAQWLYGQPAHDQDGDNPLRRLLMVPLIKDLEHFKRRFDVDVCTCYGSTEVNVPLISQFDETNSMACGRVAAGFDVRLVDEHDEQVPVDHVGELVVRTAEPWWTMIEYHRDPDATARATRNMWLHSGDAMRRDADGKYYFVDRFKDAIRRRGENISSFEVEREVLGHPGVLECAAVGVKSQSTEDDLVVVVVPKADQSVTATQIRDFLECNAPRFMVPDRVVISDRLPKTSTGKVQKHVLRQELGPQQSASPG